MKVSLKDPASWLGMVLVGLAAFLLGFAPKLEELGGMSQVITFRIALVMTVLSFVCFGIEKYLNAKDEEERKAKDAENNTLLKEVVERVRKMDGIKLTPEQITKLHQAQLAYSLLEETENKPAREAAVLMRQTLEKLTGLTLHTVYKWQDITTKLRQEVSGSDLDRTELRWAADSLVRDALEIPEDKRSNS